MGWVSQPDRGQSDAINQGLQRATGDLVSYINSDDLYYPGAFERVAREFARRPEIDFVYGDGDVIDEAGRLQWEWLSRPYDHSLMTSYHFLWNDFTNYIMQQATFWRSNVMNRIGYFDEAFHYAMDVEYWIRAGDAGLKLHHVPHKLGKFRMIQGTKSLSSPTAFWEDQLEIFRRYRGISAMGMFFGYYYCDVARHLDFDLERTLEKGKQVLSRWDCLPPTERKLIAEQADRGFALACLLIANELCRQNLYRTASTAFTRGISNSPLLRLHPFGLAYLLRRIAGRRLSRVFDSWLQRLILAYRRVRYEYRYIGRRRHAEEH